MKAVKNNNFFEKGHTYFSQTRSGKIKTFIVTGLFISKKTGECVAVKAKYDGKDERRYEVRHSYEGMAYVIADERYCTVIDTTELVEDVTITDDMITDVHEFNNCGDCTVVLNGKMFKASWNHGDVKADKEIYNAFKTYIYG